MYSQVLTGALLGIESYIANVEVDASNGMPGFEMVGMLNTEVKEARERVRVALKNIGVMLPPLHVTVNISPAHIRKNGTAYDLPVAISLMVAAGLLEQKSVEGHLIIGELGLSGEVKFVGGILPIVLEAKKNGICNCIVPKANATEGAAVQGVTIIGVETLAEAMQYFAMAESERKDKFVPAVLDVEALFERERERDDLDFEQVSGQESVKRAAEIAAAGFHNILIIGPPGSGKTMIAKRIPSVLPPLTLEESMEVSKIYSISGMLNEDSALVVKRPFCNPHHTISEQALIGGGRFPKPGIISLAHRGVLFMDEAVQFSAASLEALRQPIEDKKVQIARTYGTYIYPADFMLVAAMNPCPCGYYPDRNRCMCTAMQVKKYLSKISGPILDRIDICVEAPRIELEELHAERKGEGSEAIRKRIMKAREIQRERFRSEGLHFNADMGTEDVAKYCKLGRKELLFMEQVFRRMELSARSYHKILKVARTIADLEGSETITEAHLSEAVCLRSADRRYW